MIILTIYHVNGIFFLTSPCKSVVMCVCVCVCVCGGGGGGEGGREVWRETPLREEARSK